MASASVLSPSPPGISSLSVSQPWHTCSTPTRVYPGRICCPWYTSPGWVGMAVPYATVNIKFLMAVCRSQGVRWVISSTGNHCGAVASTAAWIPVGSTTMSVASLGLEAFQSLNLIGMCSLTIHPYCLMNFLAAASRAIGSPSGPTSVIMNRPSSFFVGPRFIFFCCDDDPDSYKKNS